MVWLSACTYTETKFERQFAVAFCHRTIDCETWQTLDEDFESCLAEMLREQRSAETEDLQYDAFSAKQCVGALYTEACAEGPFPEPCHDVYDED